MMIMHDYLFYGGNTVSSKVRDLSGFGCEHWPKAMAHIESVLGPERDEEGGVSLDAVDCGGGIRMMWAEENNVATCLVMKVIDGGVPCPLSSSIVFSGMTSERFENESMDAYVGANSFAFDKFGDDIRKTVKRPALLISAMPQGKMFCKDVAAMEAMVTLPLGMAVAFLTRLERFR